MIDRLSIDDVRALTDKTGGIAVTIFMPTQQAGREVQQNDIRLRNLLKTAEGKLLEAGMRGPEARELLKPAVELLENRPFWQHQSLGLALFVASDIFRSYRLPVSFDEEVTVNAHFHIKPVLPALEDRGALLSSGGEPERPAPLPRLTGWPRRS